MAFRVAAASSDGVNIDYHFNQAGQFYLYDLTREGFQFVETRRINKASGHSESEFDRVTALLADCGAIFVSRLGPGAARYLLAQGLRVFEAPHHIEDVLAKLINENIFQLE